MEKYSIPRKDDSCEVYLKVYYQMDGIQCTMDTSKDPIEVVFNIGGDKIPHMSKEFITKMIDELPRINRIHIPAQIPVEAAVFITEFMNSGRDTVIDRDITFKNMSPAISDINQHLPDGYNPLNPVTITNLDQVPDGFTPIPDDPPEFNDGFTEIIEDTPDEITPVEKRTLWTEDVERMNRLGYLPIAGIRGETTFPEQLGGGII